MVAYTTSVDIETPKVIESESLKVCIARREHHAARDFFRSERSDLVDLMHRHPVDIINAHWSYEFAWAAMATGIPTLVTLHDHAYTVLRYQTDFYRIVRLIMNSITLKKAKHLSVVSDYLFNKLSVKIKAKSRVINNFYSKEIAVFLNLDYPKSNYIITVCNGFGKLKNIDTALRAFALLKKQVPNMEYHLVGDGMEPSGPAHQFAKENDLSSGIKFFGKLPYKEVITKIQKARILLNPSKEESFGMAVLEAMIVGTPVIGGANSGNIPPLLNHGDSGELCDINSSKDISRSILAILQNNQYAEKLSRNARFYAQKKFSETLVISKYLQYYSDIRNEAAS